MNDSQPSPADIPSRRLSHARLEQVIYGRTPLRELLGHTPAAPGEALGDYVVADYVGSHQLDRERFDAGDLIQASARVFFEDSGAFMGSIEGGPCGKDFNLVLFATFVVIEIAPYTSGARFLVLTPHPGEAPADSPYAGLMRSHNTDVLREQLGGTEDHCALLADLGALIGALSEEPKKPSRRRGLLRRLFNR